MRCRCLCGRQGTRSVCSRRRDRWTPRGDSRQQTRQQLRGWVVNPSALHRPGPRPTVWWFTATWRRGGSSRQLARSSGRWLWRPEGRQVSGPSSTTARLGRQAGGRLRHLGRSATSREKPPRRACRRPAAMDGSWGPCRLHASTSWMGGEHRMGGRRGRQAAGCGRRVGWRRVAWVLPGGRGNGSEASRSNTA